MNLTIDPLKDVQRGLECFVDARAGQIVTHQYLICLLHWHNMVLVDVLAVSRTASQQGYRLAHYGLN